MGEGVCSKADGRGGYYEEYGRGMCSEADGRGGVLGDRL